MHFCLSFMVLLTALAGCSAPPRGIADPDIYPQDATVYLQARETEVLLVSTENQADLDADYNERFFAPWHRTAASLHVEEAFHWAEVFVERQGFVENLLPITEKRREKLVASMQRESYPLMARHAITVRNTACREFPTSRPFFLDPARPGEGFPFDYFQKSTLWAGTPLLATHVSADGAWFFVEAGYVAGWVAAGDVAWADEAFRAAYETGTYAALIADGVTLRDETGGFLAQTHIGAIFPISEQGQSGLRILVPARGAYGAALLRPVRVSPAQAVIKPLPLRPAQIAAVANRMLGQLYGWGGLYENRDCSATLRDLFTPFGVWLPRHSETQAKTVGTFHDLTGLGPASKRDYLLEHGIPFYTLVWLQGHIGLYLGTDPDSSEPMLLHNMWGIQTTDWKGREGRALVGRLAITSLHPGEERSDVPEGAFYDGILGMTVLHFADGHRAGE